MKYERIAVTRADGSVAIMSFVTEGHSIKPPFGAVATDGYNWTREASPENILDEITRAFPGEACSFRIISETDVPARDYRDAIRDDGVRLTHDMTHAREIHLNNLREERAARLKVLDVEWMKAEARRDQSAADAIEAQRQALRDMPNTVAPILQAATTIDELKAVTMP